MKGGSEHIDKLEAWSCFFNIYFHTNHSFWGRYSTPSYDSPHNELDWMKTVTFYEMTETQRLHCKKETKKKRSCISKICYMAREMAFLWVWKVKKYAAFVTIF